MYGSTDTTWSGQRLMRASAEAVLSAAMDSRDPSTPTTIPPGSGSSYSHSC
jgi:hypothetical protein